LEVPAFHITLLNLLNQLSSAFHLRAPPSLQFNQIIPRIPKFKFKEPMSAMWSSDYSTTYHCLHLCLDIVNNLSLDIGLTGVDRKVSVMKLRHPFTTWSSDYSTTYHCLQLCLDIVNNLSLDIGLTGVNRKVSVMQLRHPFNSYNIMHNQDSY
jgi:hypothetical protein